jgi:hypothetical protein
MKIAKTVSVLVLSIASIAQAQDAGSNSIVPGQSIGPVSLGMSRDEVINSLNYHKASQKHTYGVEEIIFAYKSGLDGRDSVIDVLLLGGRVIQVATSDQNYKIEGGYDTGTGMDQVKAKFPGLSAKTYYFTNKSGSRTYRFYDSVDTGVAFAVQSVGAQARYLLGGFESPDFILVHQQGRPVITIWNKLRGQTQPPPQKKPRLLQRVRLTSRQRGAAQSALRALRALETAATVGLTYTDYSRRVVDAQIIVNEKLSLLPQSDLRNELQSAMREFAGARTGWETKINNSDLEFMAKLGERMMQLSWQRAMQHTRNAAALLG